VLLGSSVGGLPPDVLAPLVPQLEQLVDDALKVGKRGVTHVSELLRFVCAVCAPHIAAGATPCNSSFITQTACMMHVTSSPSSLATAYQAKVVPCLPLSLIHHTPHCCNHLLSPQLPSRVAHNWASMVLSSLLGVLSCWYVPDRAWPQQGGLLLPNGLQLWVDRQGVGWNAPK
jgi:hypothetical protein